MTIMRNSYLVISVTALAYLLLELEELIFYEYILETFLEIMYNFKSCIASMATVSNFEVTLEKQR
jgi:hypothetical protein